MKNFVCDCFIGYLCGEQVHKYNLIERLTEQYEQQQRMLDTFGKEFYEQLYPNKSKILTPKELSDNRRGYLSRFKYCPYCGEIINWKELLKNI
jgi:hypothetical protein